MDPKMIEMNNLRVLNDYLNQTLDVLVRGQRFGNGHTGSLGGLGFSPFMGPIAAPGGIGTDVVYGPGSYGFGLSPTFAGSPAFGGGFSHPAFAGQSPFGTLPMVGAFGGWRESPWTAGQIPWTGGQTPWTGGQTWPGTESARQAQVTQALAAKQTVLEAMCRVAGIPV
jgi:hypothetical protein